VDSNLIRVREKVLRRDNCRRAAEHRGGTETPPLVRKFFVDSERAGGVS
jgi:hypothetical protein